MGYKMLTRTGRSFWEVTSVMQNSIRKGEYEIAGYCVWELLPQYESYLRRRFLVISAEDCFGVVTKEILNLSKTDGSENVERALSILCRARKNRDADYFVCNLMRGDLSQRLQKEELAKGLTDAIEQMDVVKAGVYSYGLFKKNRKFLWNTLEKMAAIERKELEDEIRALHEANETVTKPTEETIFAGKAIVLLMTRRDDVRGILSCPEIRFDGVMDPCRIGIIKRVEDCGKVKGLFPEWAYNCHTYHGKYKLRRDVVHEIENDQRLLTPLEENLFDDCSWNNDINNCLEGWNPRKIQLPYDDGKEDPAKKYPGSRKTEDILESEQMTIFQMMESE